MIAALIISLIYNVLLIGLALYINESWYRDVIEIAKDFDKEYSRMNNEWAKFCKEQIHEAINSTVDAMKEANDEN